MILSVTNVTKSFGDDVILKDITFHVGDQEKVAVVGINGAGKSTLLEIIVGNMDPDEGSVTLAKGKTIGYLAQYQETFGDRTLFGEVMEAKRDVVEMEQTIRTMEAQMQSLAPEETESFLDRYHRLLQEFEARDGYALTSEVSGILKGLGFAETDFDRRCSELSGGQKTRVALARLLVTRPDLILLDEPTNHLDIASISWLETFLSNYKGAVVVVSHDRYFLDRVVTKVVEISDHRAAVYSGNYSDYAEKAARSREERQRAYLNQQREIRHQEKVIEKLRSFNREKSVRRAESREKMLDRMEVLEKPREERSRMKITLAPSLTSGKDVLLVEGLAKSYDGKQLFSDISFDISRGEHVALIGENGTGKTTILKIINQVIDADEGMFRIGTNVNIGYYDQEQQNLHDEKTLVEEIADENPDLTQTLIRNVLAAFLFTGDDVFLRVGDLSGGERARLSIAKLMLSGANFLILDEPTNHLDIVSREILESAVSDYEGTVLFVSHDRYFINRTAMRILSLEDGRLTGYLGNYDYYLEKSEELRGGGSEAEEADRLAGQGPVSQGRADWEMQKEEQAALRKVKNRIARLENEISDLEKQIEDLDIMFEDPEIATDPERLGQIHGKQTRMREELDELYTEWEELSDTL